MFALHARSSPSVLCKQRARGLRNARLPVPRARMNRGLLSRVTITLALDALQYVPMILAIEKHFLRVDFSTFFFFFPLVLLIEKVAMVPRLRTIVRSNTLEIL